MAHIVFSDEEQARFAELGIGALVLFGSRAQGIARADSDYDIGVLMSTDDALSTATRAKVYDAVYEVLSAHIGKLVDIDIVFLREAPGELKAHVMRYGVVLFEVHCTVFADFKEHTMIEYADFAYLRGVFQSATLERIP